MPRIAVPVELDLSSFNCGALRAYTTRPRPDTTIAPEHMAQASQLVYIVVAAASSAERFVPAHRASFQLRMSGDVALCEL